MKTYAVSVPSATNSILWLCYTKSEEQNLRDVKIAVEGKTDDYR